MGQETKPKYENERQKRLRIRKERRELLDLRIREYCQGLRTFSDDEGTFKAPEKIAEKMRMDEILALVKDCLLEDYIPQMDRTDADDLRQVLLYSVWFSLKQKRKTGIRDPNQKPIKISYVVQILKFRRYRYFNTPQTSHLQNTSKRSRLS